ncbi:hypothetical protein [Prescottella agglutinans]|uniref:Uncharacterized protein n=1 Tax=Prescottella agglutinans TaxID=1644129 RepID=A0ABT6M5F3_9NOCA|nr:hypothetical protein [Prescottella agglutinans]MDH6279505.1 hypothetical protein [Prescottella agglutinans]
MTDTITPEGITAEEYRTAAKVFDARHGCPTLLSGMWRAEADRLEAESARDEYWLSVAMEVAKVWHEDGWDICGKTERRRLLEAVSVVEARLAADGRLLPEGGELTEAVKKSLTDALDTVLSACGVPTPPAVSVPDAETPAAVLDARCMAVDTEEFIVCARINGHPGSHFSGGSHYWWDAPDSGPDGTPEECLNDNHAPGCECGDSHFLAASSTLDGTPEKPWETWRQVPEGVKYQDKHGFRYVNQRGIRYAMAANGGVGHPSAFDLIEMRELAPFVRVDGDKA